MSYGHGRSSSAPQLPGCGRTRRPYQATPALMFGTLRRRHPHHRAAPAEAGDADTSSFTNDCAFSQSIAPRVSPITCSLFAVLHDVADRVHVRQRRGIAGAIEIVRRDRDIAFAREAAADILDVVVDAENLIHDDDARLCARAPLGRAT